MKGKIFLLLALWCALFSGAWAQEFPIGIWFGGNQSAIDSVSSMNFSWIQAYGGWDRNNFSTLILQNNRNLKVLVTLERNIQFPSFAQRMRYDAERTDSGNGIFNYFASPTTGQAIAGSVRQAIVTQHAAGWLAKDPIPNDQYFYERMHWVASANISIDLTGNSSAQVARIEIANGANILSQRVITEGEFSGSTAFRTFEVAYTLPPPSPSPTPVLFKMPVTATVSPQNNPAIDVRVWWYDQVNTYLDFITLEDSVMHPHLSGAYQLFRSHRDTAITNDASFFASQTTYPLLQRFYLKDEPNYNGYQPFNYVDQRILNTAGMQGSATGRGRGITATPNFTLSALTFNRFMSVGAARELLVDAYPITADIPVNPAYIPANDASNAGIAAFTTASSYNAILQPKLDGMITNSFLPAIQAANSNNAPWWFFAQVHGELDFTSGRYRSCDASHYPMLRPPSPEEIRVMVNLALAYGAKGIFYFVFETGSTTNFGNCAQVRFPGLVPQGSLNHSSNYGTFNGLNVFTGYQKKYDAVRSLNTDLLTLGPAFLNLKWKSAFTSGETAPSGSVVTSITGGSDIEIANFDSTGTNGYIMLVNRKCDVNDVQTVTVNTTKTSGHWILADQLTNEWYITSNGVFKEVKLNPGQGRLFRLRTLSGSLSWSGIVNVSTPVLVSNGSTLTIQPGTTVRFSAAAKLTIDGKLVADSNDPAKRITFTGTTSTPGFWLGIVINPGSSANNSTLRRCDVQYANNGITINYTGNSNDVTIDKCRINNSLYGIVVAGNGSGATVHPMISNNEVSNNNVGGMYLTYYAKPTITGNRVENNEYYGILATNNSSATITYNFISGHTEYGLDLSYSSHVQLHRNTVQNNGYDGVAMFFNSNVTAYGTDTTKGRNDIRFNNDTGIYAYESLPVFGKDPGGFYGRNRIQDNANYQAYQNGASGYLLLAERCWWGGQESDVAGNVDNLPTANVLPVPVGWGRNDTYDPTLRIWREEDNKDYPATLLSQAEAQSKASPQFSTSLASNGGINWSIDLETAITEGRKTGNWSEASELITELHRELQDGRSPDIDFGLVNSYTNDSGIVSPIRKMLALTLMEKELLDNNVASALEKLTAFAQSSILHSAEFIANAGLIQLYRQSDLSAAQNILTQLQDRAQTGDATAAENVKHFSRILQDYQRHRTTVAEDLAKSNTVSKMVPPPANPLLVQNYPNPFNPTTMIRFRLSESRNVQLMIFDLNGKLVRALIDGELPTGEQTIVWDGRDQSGRIAASGVYFYELRIGSKIERKKMTLVR